MASLTGYTAELRDLPPGGSLCRHARVPLAERNTLDRLRRDITAANAKAPGTFTTQTLDAVTDDFSHAVRVVVTTRLS